MKRYRDDRAKTDTARRALAKCIGKPRPAVIVQDDRFDATDSTTICVSTTDPTDVPLLRLPVEPNDRNGLRAPSRLMVDKITTFPKTKMGTRVGYLDNEGGPLEA